MRTLLSAILCSGLALACVPRPAAADVLITEAEAKLPNPPDAVLTRRGITRGPAIEQVSPSADAKSPLLLKVKFITRNNVEIDTDSVKLTYLKAPSVDLTARIKKYVTANGIEMDGAEAPPGQHVLRLDLMDKRGRVSSAFFRLSVAAK
jgi:hypothetical protein